MAQAHRNQTTVEELDRALAHKDETAWTWGDLFKGLFWISPLGGILAPERAAIMKLIRERDLALQARQGAEGVVGGGHSDSHKD